MVYKYVSQESISFEILEFRNKVSVVTLMSINWTELRGRSLVVMTCLGLFRCKVYFTILRSKELIILGYSILGYFVGNNLDKFIMRMF